MKKLFVILSFLISSVGYATEPTDTLKRSKVDTLYLEKLVVSAISEYRLTKGKTPLVWDDQLGEGSRKHSVWMEKTDNYMHAGNIESAGECILWGGLPYGFTYEESAKIIMNSWVESSGHNYILLMNNFSKGGVGIVPIKGTYNGMYATFRISGFINKTPIFYTYEELGELTY